MADYIPDSPQTFAAFQLTHPLDVPSF
jgi:hypothetical protein